ncbi:TetR/AcrR family transcriptional regulator [Aliisedimentitalea scapharcae]|uniref:TetR/AcrR family transcriptional regulator n=1 Tax=Aliisedimentitalea scapharcae TaxID=1524259 RepID=A0ABZ2XP28_9RHOB|nr:TetR/AcrR family transcriptional regulator [Rhodobacteraceae bacterium M382]
MSRPRQFDETNALEGAMVMFWTRGYAATNLPDLLDAMSLTRGSFYKAFTDKHSVYLRAIQHYGDTRMTTAVALLTNAANGTPRQRLTDFFLRTEYHTAKPSRTAGCFICNAIVELGPTDPVAVIACDRILNRLTDALESVVREIHPDISDPIARQKAQMLKRLYLGSHAMGRMGGSFKDWETTLSELV